MKRYKQRDAGFTLVELLVVITIIGMLMALLLPAVNAAVELARAAACKNNMRNLAIACNTFESAQQRFPGYREFLKYKGSVPPPSDVQNFLVQDANGEYWVAGQTGYGGNQPFGMSWIVSILPGLDHHDWYDRFSSGRIENLYSELFVCPSDPPVSTTEGFNSYIINAGHWYNNSTGRPANGQENRANGIAFDYAGLQPDEPINTGPTTSAEYVSAGDGMAYTVLLSENVTDSEWFVGGKQLVQFDTSFPVRVPAVFVWHEGSIGVNRDNPIREINGRGSQHGSLLDVPAQIDAERPSSFHTGQVHVSFCDTRTVDISEGIEYVVYKQLMTSNAAESDMTAAEKARILTDNDYR